MRPLAAILLLLSCAGCAATPEGGVATYDALKAATDACAAKGGSLTLVRNGDPQVLADYACKRK